MAGTVTMAEAVTIADVCPSVSVVIPLYNAGRDLPDLLHCLRNQTYPSDRVQYLLVDNNSQDNTATLLAQAVPTLPGLQPLTEAEIQSSYAARNRGIHSATGDLILFTDGDCRPQPQWLERMVQPFADPAVGLVVGQLTALPGSHWLERYAKHRELMDQRYTLAHPLGAYGQTANLGVRRSALGLSGLFRPYLTTGGDADLCWRLQRSAPWTVAFAETAIVQHRHRSTWSGLMEQWHRYGTSNGYLHHLHGAKRQSPPSARRIFYILGRWLLKEVGLGVGSVVLGQKDWVQLVATPIDLWCDYVRYRGQQRSQLPAAAHTIEPYTPPTDLRPT